MYELYKGLIIIFAAVFILASCKGGGGDTSDGDDGSSDGGGNGGGSAGGDTFESTEDATKAAAAVFALVDGRDDISPDYSCFTVSSASGSSWVITFSNCQIYLYDIDSDGCVTETQTVNGTLLVEEKDLPNKYRTTITGSVDLSGYISGSCKAADFYIEYKKSDGTTKTKSGTLCGLTYEDFIGLNESAGEWAICN